MYAVPAIIFRRIEIISLTFGGRCRKRRRRRKRTTMVVRTAALSESNRDHVFGCHKSHYRDGSVPSVCRRVIVLLSVLFCRFRSARPEFRPDVDTHVYAGPSFSLARDAFSVSAERNFTRPRPVFLVSRTAVAIALSPLSFETRALSRRQRYTKRSHVLQLVIIKRD